MVVNSLPTALDGARLKVSSYNLAGKLLDQRDASVDAAPLSTTDGGMSVANMLANGAQVILTKLELFGADNKLISENLYWLSGKPETYRKMNEMKPARLIVAAEQSRNDAEHVTKAIVTNTSSVPALMIKLSALDQQGERVLPAYWSDNYLTLLPGETRTVVITSPISASRPSSIQFDGWNVGLTSTQIAE